MAAREPARKRTTSASASKRTSAKKAAVKRAPVKRAPVKRAPVKRAPAKKAPAKKVVPPAATPVPITAPAGPAAVVAPPAAPTVAPGRAGPTLVERVVALDWANAVRIAGPTFLVLLAAAAVVSTTALIASEAPDDVPVFGSPSGDRSVGQFFHGWAAVAALAVGSPITLSAAGEGFGLSLVSRAVPLTVTFLMLLVYGGLVRRYTVGATRAEAIARTAMSSVIFALLAMGTSFGARMTVREDTAVPDETFELIEDDSFTQSASPGHAFGWSLLMTAVLGSLVLYAPTIIERVRSDLGLARLRQWRLPLEGAAAALVAAVVMGGVAGIASLFAEASDVGADMTDVVSAVPALLGYFVSIGVFVSGMAMGASVKANAGGFDPGDDASLGYAHMHGLSPAYFLLLVLPVLASLVGIAWMNRRRTDEDARALSRAYYRMALPFAVGWAFLAVIARVEFGAGGLGGVTVGPQILVGFALALGWTLVVGVLAGQTLLRRGLPPSAPASTWRLEWRWSWRPIALVAGVAIVAVAVAAIASGGGRASAPSSRTGPVVVQDAWEVLS